MFGAGVVFLQPPGSLDAGSDARSYPGILSCPALTLPQHHYPPDNAFTSHIPGTLRDTQSAVSVLAPDVQALAVRGLCSSLTKFMGGVHQFYMENSLSCA